MWTNRSVGAYYLFPDKAFIATDCRPQCPQELTQREQMMAIIDQSDLSHWDFPLNVLESDAICRRASRYVPQATPSSGCFSFQSWFFRAICPWAAKRSPHRKGISIRARGAEDGLGAPFDIQQCREPRDKACPERAEGWVPRYLETDYFAVCPITSGSTGVPSACTASSAAGSSPNA
jgi:hypothetical protein